ncbi:hypothetical protein JCM14244_07880 [Venenivibrio stagnispumantis]|uniref:CRISPR-associated protein Cmr3 n=1 Tax=Venenivibrio stagnispumantis TaxID=407998 RepID=A0AA45WNV1_9AQUI|nr:type III-B CRISPR module-associated Cmr3 family protein [Venenivibrio stagnispumantis]MCW4573977.1 CRISPR-associated protein [Venenivibrio stagnispumantis]SMP19253.1 CRISPR-associated protein Cmr3 [Venenivibrio stagnispumantis]
MIKIMPIDVLIFGNGKPFNAGEDNFKSGNFFLNPVPILSALNKKTGKNLNISFISYIEENKFFFKTPADIKLYEKEIIIPRLNYTKEIFSNIYDLEYTLDYEIKEKLKNPQPYISEDGLKNYLKSEKLEEKDFKNLYETELRAGISLERKTRTTKEGYLYFQDFLRFYEDVNIAVETEDNIQLDYITVGGESKSAKIQNLDIDIKERFKDIKEEIKKSVKEDKFFKIVLLTPTNGIPYIEGAKLLIQQIESIISYSGWINLHNQNKSFPTRIFRLIPEGSVFYYKLEDENKLDEIFDRFWLKPSFLINEYPYFDVKNPAGFGLSIIGKVGGRKNG